jgi:hypothetical protein
MYMTDLTGVDGCMCSCVYVCMCVCMLGRTITTVCIYACMCYVCMYVGKTVIAGMYVCIYVSLHKL